MNSLILKYFLSSHWAMEPQAFDQMRTIVERHANGEKLSDEQIQSAIGRAPRTPNPRDRKYEIHQGIAMIPVQGPLVKHAASVSDLSGPPPTSYEQIQGMIDTALADDQVECLMLHIESPGGAADGCDMLYQSIQDADAQKPCMAFIDGVGASAAYYIASACRQIMATQSSLVGSIGTMIAMRDTSKSDEKYGVRTVVVRSGPKKALGAGGEPITDEAIASRQKIVDGLAGQFYAAVSKGRNLTGEALDKVTDGDIHLAGEAKKLGLIDSIGSLADAIHLGTTLGAAARPRPRMRMADTSTSNGSAQAGSASNPSLAPDQQLKGNDLMKISPAKLAELNAAHPAHAVMITNMAAGVSGKEPASESEILAAIQVEDNKGKDATIADLERQVKSLNDTSASLRAKHAQEIQARDEQIVALKASVAEKDVAIENYKKGNRPLETAHKPSDNAGNGSDAIAAFNAKVEEYRKAGHKQPFGHTVSKHPELHHAYVAASNPGMPIGGAQ